MTADSEEEVAFHLEVLLFGQLRIFVSSMQVFFEEEEDVVEVCQAFPAAFSCY